MTELEQGVWCAAFALAFRDAKGGVYLPVDVAALCSKAADRAVEALRRLDK